MNKEIKQIFKVSARRWRDDSVMKNTCFSCRGPRLDFQNIYGGSQSFKTPVTVTCGFSSNQACTYYTYIHAGKTLIIQCKNRHILNV